jgi:hypothetical protein
MAKVRAGQRTVGRRLPFSVGRRCPRMTSTSTFDGQAHHEILWAAVRLGHGVLASRTIATAQLV